jgi:hypothetical protein
MEAGIINVLSQPGFRIGGAAPAALEAGAATGGASPAIPPAETPSASIVLEAMADKGEVDRR